MNLTFAQTIIFFNSVFLVLAFLKANGINSDVVINGHRGIEPKLANKLCGLVFLYLPPLISICYLVAKGYVLMPTIHALILFLIYECSKQTNQFPYIKES